MWKVRYMKYTSKEALIENLKVQLATNPRVTEKAILRICEYQTISEQASRDVKVHNNVGFTPADAYLMTSFAAWLKGGHHLTEKQLHYAFKMMPKYARQLINQSIEKGLIKKVSKEYTWTK